MSCVPPTPPDMGFDAALFPEWREQQPEAIERITASSKRFFGLSAPTGSGKSLTYIAGSLLRGGHRTVILTSTKALQNQLLRDFQNQGIKDIRGRAAYPCHWSEGMTADIGPCRIGVECQAKGTQSCAYYRALIQASRARVMVSNYAFWMRDYRERLAEDVDTLVCDEAHALPQIMTGSLAVSITPKAQFYRHPCPTGTSPDDWARWAMNVAQEIELETGMLRAALNQDDTTGETTTVEGLPKQLTRLLRAADKMAQLSKINSEEWVVSQEADRVIFTPVWVKDFVEGLLFKEVKTVILSSATLCRKTLELLGVSGEETEFTEFRHTFPVEMRRLYYVPTVRINKGTSDVSMRRVVNTIDAFVSKRLDRKGIIHTVSYKRRDFVLKHSDYASIMLTNETRTIADAVLAFKQAPAPCILVSPSVSTGFDFIYDECSYQILLKVPYPNMGDPVVKKRMEQDAEYAAYIAAQELVQACGRGTRAADDFCESVILDDVFDRFIKWHKTLFPRWFLEAVVRTGLVPEPPDRR